MHYKLKLLALRLAPAFVRRKVMVSRYANEVAGTGEAELAQLGRFVTAGATALDIGCNLGVYSYELSRLGARVVALEPNPYLAKLVESLALPNVEVRQAAASSSEGSAILNVPIDHLGGHGWASLRNDRALGRMEEITVPVHTIDNLAPGKVDFIKIDVEGFEEEVIRGAEATIARDRPILLVEIEERHNAGAVARIETLLANSGYTAWYVRAGAWHRLDTGAIGSLQDLDRLAADEARRLTRRKVDYVNNFFFLPERVDTAGLR